MQPDTNFITTIFARLPDALPILPPSDAILRLGRITNEYLSCLVHQKTVFDNSNKLITIAYGH